MNAGLARAGLDSLIDEVLAPPPARGRRPKHIFAEYRRDINEADVQALWDLPAGGLDSNTRPLVKLRFQHHYLARLIAQGEPDTRCALCTGYSPSRISILKGDPAFQELISYYKTQVEEVYIDVHQRLAAMSLNSLEELQDRLDTEPEKFSIRELKELVEMGMDRTGHGPQSKVQHSGNVGFLTGDVLEKLKAEVRSRENGQIRSLAAPSNNGAEMGSPILDLTVASPEEPARREGEGLDVRTETGEETQ